MADSSKPIADRSQPTAKQNHNISHFHPDLTSLLINYRLYMVWRKVMRLEVVESGRLGEGSAK
jgi:hypothetical protein